MSKAYTFYRVLYRTSLPFLYHLILTLLHCSFSTYFFSICFSVVLFCIFILNHHKFHIWFYVYANYVLVLLEHLKKVPLNNTLTLDLDLQYNPSELLSDQWVKHKKKHKKNPNTHIKSQHDQMFCSPLFLNTINSFICVTFTMGQILSLVHYFFTKFPRHHCCKIGTWRAPG